jgi:hypothetical protein
MEHSTAKHSDGRNGGREKKGSEYEGGGTEREMCPWAISKYFGDWVPTQVLKCKSMPMDGQVANQK